MELTAVDILMRLMLGGAIGFVIGLTGIGAVLAVPSLSLILNLPPSIAVGTASLYAFLSRLSAAYHHFHLKTIDFSIALFFLIGAVPANITTSLLINRYLTAHSNDVAAIARFQGGMKMAIAGMIVLAGVVMTANLFRKPRADDDETGLAQRLDRMPVVRRTLAAVLGGAIGILMGATAIGGGVLVVPLLILVFGLPPSTTVGTAIIIASVLSMMTAIIYGSGSQQDWLTAVIMAAGSLVSVRAGSKLAVKLPEKNLRIVVICTVVLSAALMILKGRA